MDTITVKVPATSANCGPGFDSLGLALELYNTFTFTPDKTASANTYTFPALMPIRWPKKIKLII